MWVTKPLLPKQLGNKAFVTLNPEKKHGLVRPAALIDRPSYLL